MVNGYDGDGKDDYETTINSMIERVNDQWRCKVCGKEYIIRNKTSLKGQIERYHTSGFTHTCNLCGKEFQLKGSLVVHRSKNHKGVINLTNLNGLLGSDLAKQSKW